MATPEQINDLVALYAGYFNRAPDPEGLQFWIDQIDGGREFNTIAADFAASEEATALYPYLTTPDVATPSTFITSIYQNLFNRAPEPEGLQFWTDVLESGSVSVADMIEAIINGAVDAPDATPPTFDATTLENKIEVGRDFAQDAANTSGFEFDAEAKSAAIAAIDGVTNDEATVVAAKAATDAYLAGEANEGETLTLTTGVDDINGTADNDIINALTVNATTGAAASTLTAFDDIDGGAGTDTLNIYTAATTTTDETGDEPVTTTEGQNIAFPASASVKNVEIVNILNSDEAVAALANASNYTGVQQLWQVNAAAAVSELEATTAAGFRNIEDTDLEVSAADDATSATVALDNVDDDSSLTVEGDALNSVTVVGAVVDADEDGVDAINLTANVGKDQQTLAVNTAVDVNLAFDDEGSAANAKVTAIDASASTGGISFRGDAQVSNLQTGSGDDTVTLNTALSADVPSASVETGAGDDEITLAATGKGNVTADAGAGDDTVNVSAIDALSTASSVDGGEGTDTLAIGAVAEDKTSTGNEEIVPQAVATAELALEDYALLNSVFVNFEKLSFAENTTFDASRLSDYKSFTLQTGGTVTKVADDQAITTGDDLDVTAAGYKAVEGKDTVYAGNLNVTAIGTTTVTAKAESVVLTAAATEDSAADVTLAGDVQEATVNVNSLNYVDDEGIDQFNGAEVTVETADGALDALTTLTLAGNGSAEVTNGAETALVTVDASALNSVDDEGEADTGLIYSSDNAAAETVTLGDGLDEITLNASTVLNTDSIVGFNLATDDEGDFDAAASDDLDFAGITGTVSAIGEVTGASLDIALINAVDDASNEANGLIFDFGGDTYVYDDTNADGIVDDSDALVQLVGGVDQDLLAEMFGTNPV
ncbi:DUF4214 domain-containing protein [Sulfitobacter sp. 1A12057]|uniref:DUF4214 domain-containing protein n=1 Tax=Sulfitobacter sp. 1A12057 TaxID=3368567 RepID=UPI003746646F